MIRPRKTSSSGNAEVKSSKTNQNKKTSKTVSRKKAKNATNKKTAQKEPFAAHIKQQERTHQPADVQQQQGFQMTQAAELPGKYDEDNIVTQVRDPFWLHVYWEVKSDSIEGLKIKLGPDFYDARMNLRIYDVTDIIFNGTNAHNSFDIEVFENVSDWYVQLPASGRSWVIDVGFKLKNGTFIVIARSNVITTPLGEPSSITDEEWMIPEKMFARLFGADVLNDALSSFGKWRVTSLGVSSGAVSSWGVSSWGGKKKKAK